MDIFQIDIENELRLHGVSEIPWTTHEYDGDIVAGGLPSWIKYNPGRLFSICQIESLAGIDSNGLRLNHDWLNNEKLDNKYFKYQKYRNSMYTRPLICFQMDINAMINDFILSMDITINGWFLFGSMVIYDLSSTDGDDLTDIDVVIITDDVPHGTKFSYGLLDIQTMTVDYFNSHNDGSDELILQMLFHRNASIDWKRHTHFYSLGDDLDLDTRFDHSKIRRCISGKSSNSYVKAKKKLIVADDYDKYASMKSLIHSIRLLNLGITVSRTDGESGLSEEDAIAFRGINIIRALYSSLNDDEIVESIENGEIKECYKKLKRAFKHHCSK